jgi:hypothetical protein
MVVRNGLAVSALIRVGLARIQAKDTDDGPATAVAAITKVSGITKVSWIRKVLAIGKRPKIVAVDAGRRHGKVFSSGIARGSLRSIDAGRGARAAGATGIGLPAKLAF